MTCLYEVTMDDLFRAFIQIANDRSWLRSGSIGKGHNPVSLKLKVASKCGNLELLADAIRSYLGAEDLNTRDGALEGSELFGSTK